jgi:hypothetical protein
MLGVHILCCQLLPVDRVGKADHTKAIEFLFLGWFELMKQVHAIYRLCVPCDGVYSRLATSQFWFGSRALEHSELYVLSQSNTAPFLQPFMEHDGSRCKRRS